MTIKVYISGICGSHEVRKHQQRVLFILQSLPIDLQIVDITEPGRDGDLVFMQEEAKKHDKKTQLPPQIFNGTEYCGDYADFELANDDDEIMTFLKLETSSPKSGEPITQNGISDHVNNQESSNELAESILNNTEENSVANEEGKKLNDADSNVNEEKDSSIETSVNEDTDVTKEEISKIEPAEEKAKVSEEEEESE